MTRDQLGTDQALDRVAHDIAAAQVRPIDDVCRVLRELMPCGCGDPSAPRTIHRRNAPCTQEELREHADGTFSRPGRVFTAPAGTEPGGEGWHELCAFTFTIANGEVTFDSGPDTPGAYGGCPLCRKAFERDEQRVEVLMNGGDAEGIKVCVECAMDRPTVLIPALRPVGDYTGRTHDPVDAGRCPHAWLPRTISGPHGFIPMRRCDLCLLWDDDGPTLVESDNPSHTGETHP